MIYSHLITYITREGVKMTDLALILIAFFDFILGILSKITIFCDIFLTVLIIILSFKYKKYFPSAMLYENEMKEFFGEGLPRIC